VRLRRSWTAADAAQCYSSGGGKEEGQGLRADSCIPLNPVLVLATAIAEQFLVASIVYGIGNEYFLDDPDDGVLVYAGWLRRHHATGLEEIVEQRKSLRTRSIGSRIGPPTGRLLG
jgi:hypothetical protein